MGGKKCMLIFFVGFFFHFFILQVYCYEGIYTVVQLQLNFQFVDKILWCDHSNKTSLAVLLNICISTFHKMKFVFFIKFLFLAHLGVKELREVKNFVFTVN